MRRTPRGEKRRARRARRVVLGVAIAGMGFLTGCPVDPQKAQVIMGVITQVVAAMTGRTMPGGMTTSTDPQALINAMLGYPNGTSIPNTYGPVNNNWNPGGIPQKDASAQIPNFGPNPSKAQIAQMLEAAARKYGIPPDLLKAVAYQESRWNPRATSFDGGHGKGVMQIDDRFHQFARTSAVFDPAQNIDYGARYLREAFDKTRDWDKALKRYNGGSDYPPIIRKHEARRPWVQEFGVA